MHVGAAGAQVCRGDPIAAGVLPYGGPLDTLAFAGSGGGWVVVHTRDEFWPVALHLTR